jgi:hypothetical protein
LSPPNPIRVNCEDAASKVSVRALSALGLGLGLGLVVGDGELVSDGLGEAEGLAEVDGDGLLPPPPPPPPLGGVEALALGVADGLALGLAGVGLIAEMYLHVDEDFSVLSFRH